MVLVVREFIRIRDSLIRDPPIRIYTPLCLVSFEVALFGHLLSEHLWCADKYVACSLFMILSEVCVGYSVSRQLSA